ncbi:hypothetical protein ACLOJK_040737 [Asimina triloba]
MVMTRRRDAATDEDYGRRSAPDGGIRRWRKGKPERKEGEAVMVLLTLIGFFNAVVDDYGMRSAQTRKEMEAVVAVALPNVVWVLDAAVDNYHRRLAPDGRRKKRRPERKEREGEERGQVGRSRGKVCTRMISSLYNSRFSLHT